MSYKKQFFAVCLLILVLPALSLAQAQTEDIKQTYDNAKNTVEKNWPSWSEKLKKDVMPFCEKAWQNTNAWLAKNMPAAAEELKNEGQSLPQEFLKDIKSGWDWLLNYLKK